jgi:hypothetical protein
MDRLTFTVPAAAAVLAFISAAPILEPAEPMLAMALQIVLVEMRLPIAAVVAVAREITAQRTGVAAQAVLAS